MRFKAKISKEALLTFHGVICQMQRIGNFAVIYLSEDCVRLAVVSESVDTPRCYSELSSEILFSDYRLESQSSNKILLEVGLDNFSMALASGKHSSQSHLKLVKRGLRPCLNFETQSLEALSLNITHDVPIRILPASDIIYYNPPDIPPPTVSLELPRTKLLRIIVEKMTKFAKHVYITASQTGNIVFEVEHSGTLIKTYYTGLIPRFEGNLRVETDRDNKASMKIELRKLSLILNNANLLWDGAFVFITDNYALILHIILSPPEAGSLTYYLPAITVEH